MGIEAGKKTFTPEVTNAIAQKVIIFFEAHSVDPNRWVKSCGSSERTWHISIESF
jgi:hypothetical protein